LAPEIGDHRGGWIELRMRRRLDRLEVVQIHVRGDRIVLITDVALERAQIDEVVGAGLDESALLALVPLTRYTRTSGPFEVRKFSRRRT
jgi:hypothetical protein